MAEARGNIGAGALVLGLLGLLVGALTEFAPVFLVSAVIAFAADQELLRNPNWATRLLARLQLGFAARTWLRGGLLFLGLAAMRDLFAGPGIVASVVAVLALGLGNAMYARAVLALRGRSDAEVAWRNFPVNGETASRTFQEPVPSRLGGRGVQLIALSEALLIAGAIAAVTARWSWWLLAGALATCVAVAVVVLLGMLAWLRMRRRGPVAGTNAVVRKAFAKTEPEVVFYFSSPASGSYALGVWVDVIRQIRRPCAIVLREASHLAVLESLDVPIVVLPLATDVEEFALPSMRAVLYPTNVIKNNHMVRLGGMMHCFIGHGDSDKAGSFSPVTRVYDEIWVAGQAGVDRYEAIAEGVRREQLRIVGRPQLAAISRRVEPLAPPGVRTVLYAPTWEGFFEPSNYSSLPTMGVGIVRALLEAGVTVLFKPHPATGERMPEAIAAQREIEELLTARPGEGHEVIGQHGSTLYDAFNRADLLITDVSSLITDFLASRKPYVVTNTRSIDPEEFRTQFPSVSAGYLLGPDVAGLRTFLEDAGGADSLRADRQRLAEYLLGAEGDPLEGFLDEVDAFVERSESANRRRNAAAAAFQGVRE